MTLNSHKRRQVLRLAGNAVLLAVGCGALAPVQAEEFPSHPVRLVSPYGPGGSNDISARLLSEGLSRKYKQQFVVENKPGAGTRVANEQIARATPDGLRARIASKYNTGATVGDNHAWAALIAARRRGRPRSSTPPARSSLRA